MGLSKKIIDQRIELLQLICHEVKISQNGNYYGIPLSHNTENPRTVYLGERSLRKANFFRDYGKYRTFNMQNTVLMVSKSGGLKIKQPDTRWQNLTAKKLRFITKRISDTALQEEFQQRIKDHPIYKDYTFENMVMQLFFKGRKYEWLFNYQGIMDYQIMRNFKNLKEAKHFFGYEFLGNAEFYQHLTNNYVAEFMFYAANLEKEDRVNLFHHLKENRIHYMRDILQMWQKIREKEEDYPFFRIPSNHDDLKDVHDEITHKHNLVKAADYSDVEKQVESPLFEAFEKAGLEYVLLNSERKMYIAASTNRHCMASRTQRLSQDLFFSFKHEDEFYELQAKNDKMYEFRGYKNKDVPEELKNKVEQCFADCQAEVDKLEETEDILRKKANRNFTFLWEIDAMNKETNNTVNHPANNLMAEMNEIVMAQPQDQWDDLPF